MKKIHLIIPLWAILMSVFLVLWKKDLFFNELNVQQAIDDFSVSQYVLGDAYKKNVNDEVVYVTAAIAQNSGINPTEINFEHPPMGKYLIGLGILLFKNPLWINLLAYIATIMSIGLILQNWNMPKHLIIFGMGLFSLSGSFVPQQFSNIMLDGFYICFYTIFLAIFFIKSSSISKNLLLGIFGGLLFSTKYSIPLGFMLTGIPIGIGYLEKKFRFTDILIMVISAGSVYLASYWVYFNSGKNLIDFLYFEWYRLKWWFGDRTMPSWLILSSLFKGYYPAWFSENQNEVVKMTGWTLLFPLQFLTSTILGLWLLFKERNSNILILLSISLSVFIATGVGKSSDLKYLIIVMPVWSLILTKTINDLLKK